MTAGEIERILMAAPKREFDSGSRPLRGYFQEELLAVGVPKGKLKKLVRKGVIRLAIVSFPKGLKNFYTI